MCQLEDEAKRGVRPCAKQEETMNQAGIFSSVLEGRCAFMPPLCSEDSVGKVGVGICETLGSVHSMRNLSPHQCQAGARHFTYVLYHVHKRSLG